MRLFLSIWFCGVLGFIGRCQTTSFEFYGHFIALPHASDAVVPFHAPVNAASVQDFYNRLHASALPRIAAVLRNYKKEQAPDDWVFYQLVRRTAETLSPKADNYIRYTLYKWYLLTQTGYSTLLTASGNKLLMYVHSPDPVYEIPVRQVNGLQYVCLNYHDYMPLNFEAEPFAPLLLQVTDGGMPFSYRITKLPRFEKESYTLKDVDFTDGRQEYQFKILVNHQVKKIFANYPVLDYAYYFDMPLSTETYGSLIPLLKDAVKGMSQKSGVAYLMRFTRQAFSFAPDAQAYGKEKRLSPEQLLLYDYSDCEDRAAFFYYLVKEIYNLPMIVLAYPQHVTVAVQFQKPMGHSIAYKGQQYSICEATPQRRDLAAGQLPAHLRYQSFEVVHAYEPK